MKDIEYKMDVIEVYKVYGTESQSEILGKRSFIDRCLNGLLWIGAAFNVATVVAIVAQGV